MANPIDLIESKIKEIIESSVLLFPWMVRARNFGPPVGGGRFKLIHQ